MSLHETFFWIAVVSAFPAGWAIGWWLGRRPLKVEPPKPVCYGDYPFLHPQEAAERDCMNCRDAYACHEDSPRPRPDLR